MPKSERQPSSQPSSTPWIRLALILLVGLALRILYTHGQSITFDENFEIMLAQQDIGYIFAKADGFPPTYAILLKIWQNLFGLASGRSMSIVFGLLCCLGAYGHGRQIGTQRLGLWTAGLTAILPIHVFYSSEVRAYSALLFVATMALFFAIRVVQDNRRSDWIGFCIFATLGIYTHYLFAIFVGLSLLVMIAMSWDKKPVAAGAVIVAAILPLRFFFAPADFSMQAGWYYRVQFGIGELAYTYGSFLTGYTVGPSQRELHSLGVRKAFVVVFPWAIVIAFAIFAIIWSTRRDWPLKRKETPLLVVLSLAPVLMGLICMAMDIGYQVRYAIWAIVPIILLLSWLGQLGSKNLIGRIGIGTLIVVFTIAIWNRHSVDRYRNEDLGNAAEYLMSSRQFKQPIIFVSGYMTAPMKYYLDESWTIDGVPFEFDFEKRIEELDAVLDRCARSDSKFWFLYTREFHEDWDGIMLDRVKERTELTLEKEWAGISLYRGARRADATPDGSS